MTARRLVAEGVGTALLVAAVVGSGITGDRLSAGNAAIALLANTLATGAALVALILTFGPLSGAHLNPVVTLADAARGGVPWRLAPGYLAAQFAGAVAGVVLGNVLFGLPAIALATQARPGWPLVLSEFVATFGLVLVVASCSTHAPAAAPWAVAGFVMAAYWFTPSTSFANPAVTIARALTDTFAGIRPADVPGFLLAQGLGAAGATLLWRWLAPPPGALRARPQTA